MAATSITEFDLFFLSFDEPNAEKHFSDLREKAPWAERVHGVQGFAAAHRACAEQSQTDWFITVDADNIVRPGFFDLRVEIGDNPLECLSWNGLNMINGLRYGNGGVKLWSKEFVLSDRIGHEAVAGGEAVDFCWDANYRQMPETFSEVWPNGSALQAFRAGFREGVKLTLDRGRRVAASEMKTKLHPMNLRNLKIWCSVGGDVDEGDWAMYGALSGWNRMCDPDFDHTVVSDFAAFNALFAAAQEEFGSAIDNKQLRYDIRELTGIEIPYLDDGASEFFREVFAL